MDIIFHYPPELLSLLIDTIPLLNRSKKDVLLFFKGAGASDRVLADLWDQVEVDRESITKFEIVRTVLTRLNEQGEDTLRERREVLKRILEFEEFSTCWPDDQLKAKGLVASIRRVVNVKDSFTRMRLEREAERNKHRKQQEERIRQIEEKRRSFEQLKGDFYHLFGDIDPKKRGALLEGVMNRLFKHFNISVRESFCRTGETGEGVIEQIDGVIELDADIYLVEMKWLSRHVDVNDVSRHLVRIYHRHSSRGVFISATKFTPAALKICTDALEKTVVVLLTLQEIFSILEREGDLKALLKTKVQAAIIEKQPYKSIMS